MAQCMCLCVFLSISLLFSTPVSWTQFLFPLAMPTPLLSIKNTHYNQNHPLVNPRQISHPLPRLSLSCPITRHYIRDNYYRKLVYYWQSLCHPFNNNITSTCAVAHCACRGFDKYACTFIHTYIIQNHKHIHTHTHTQNGGRGDDVSLFSPIFYLFYRGPLPPTEQWLPSPPLLLSRTWGSVFWVGARSEPAQQRRDAEWKVIWCHTTAPRLTNITQ